MPEEVNRILTDHVSTLLFCPTETAVGNLSNEGISSGVHNTGDVMYDALLYNLTLVEKKSKILSTLGLKPKDYVLATIHRASNTDKANKLRAIINSLGKLDTTIVFPIHPRTKIALNASRIHLPDNILAIDPIGYLDMIQLEKNADCVLTDSGGIQKEAYLLGVRCITFREETEWVETVKCGWNKLVNPEKDHLDSCYEEWYPTEKRQNFFGEGNAAQKISDLINESSEKTQLEKASTAAR
jgi:UDP-N-acetylglucosamine 2-epimerase